MRAFGGGAWNALCVLASRNTDSIATPEVCPDAAPPISAPSDWARAALAFNPSEKQSEVLDYTGARLILNCARQWGKSTVIAIKALHAALNQPGIRIVVLARSEDQAGLLVEKVQHNAAKLAVPYKRVRGRAHSLEFSNGARVYAIAHAERTVLGHTADILIVDEAAVVKDEVYAAILPALARTNGKLWLLSTPRGQSGIFYNVWNDPERTEWLKVMATIDDLDYAGKEFIEEYKRAFPHRVDQDFYCRFLPPEGRLVSRQLIEGMLDPTIHHVPFPRL